MGRCWWERRGGQIESCTANLDLSLTNNNDKYKLITTILLQYTFLSLGKPAKSVLNTRGMFQWSQSGPTIYIMAVLPCLIGIVQPIENQNIFL